MNVQELSTLHRRYLDLSHRFRAAWVFHQFLESVRKVYSVDAESQFATEFQKLYAELKEISHGLTSTAAERMRGRLEEVENRLENVGTALDAQDAKVSPKVLRRFFERFKNYDEKILLQLSRFYIFACLRKGWRGDRLDKLDFLVTRLARGKDEEPDIQALLGRKHLQEVFHSLWTLTGDEPPADSSAEMRETIRAYRDQIPEIRTFDDLAERQVLAAFRQSKHSLGKHVLVPETLGLIIETNLAFRDLVRRLFHQEERRIVSEYQQVFELEGSVVVDIELDQELHLLRQEVEHFEKRLQEEEFDLDELARIRRRVRTLVPRLQGTKESQENPTPVPGRSRRSAAPASAAHEPPSASLTPREGQPRELLGPVYERLMAVLEDCDPESAPRAVSLRPEVFPFRLEPREVVAYRRLAAEASCDRELEGFLLESAALRVRMSEEADEIKSLLDETSRDLEAPVYQRARVSLRLADRFLWRFAHILEQALLEGEGEEGRQLQMLRMRLMREYSGLWLLSYKPFINGQGPAA